MKRGFLNTQKARKRTAEAVESEAGSKSKDKKRDGSHPDTEGIGIPMPDLDSHKLPKSIQAQCGTKSRIIFRIWPRAPNGEAITPSPLRGKEAGNGLNLWGATLYDFYYVNRMPSVKNYITTSTSSRLAKWMRQAGELTADNELAWADKEEDPREIPVADIGELIRCRDTRVDMGLYDRFSSRKEVREKMEKDSSAPPSPSLLSSGSEAEDGEGSISQVNDQNGDAEKSTTPGARLGEPIREDKTGDSSPEKCTDESAVSPLQHDEPMQVDETGDMSPATGTNEPAVCPSKDDPFHPDNYPSPWPFIPCSIDDPPPFLQQRIPLHLLPQKIHVHDPWNRLSISEGDNDHNTSWLTKVTEGEDIIRTYSLSLSEEGNKAASESKEKAELAENEEAAKESAMRIFPAEKEGPTDEPMIEVVLPPRPWKPTHLEEAHLYIAPPALGKGNHSYVYFAEWELPRDLFIRPKLCKVCIEEDARKQLQAWKNQGKWEDLLKASMEKPEVTQVSDEDAPSELDPLHAVPKGKVGHITIKEHSLPHVTVSMVDSDGPLSKHPHTTGNEKTAYESTTEEGPVASTANHAMETADIEMDVVEVSHVEPGDEGGSEEPSAEKNDQGKGKGKRKRTLEQDEEDEEAADEDRSGEEDDDEEIFTIQPPAVYRIASYSGPVVRIYSTVKWQDSWGTKCKHMGMSPGAVPRTATVSVVAKLSIEYDTHLERESRNYQKFPSHFFEHWNGYNVIPPLKDPVPIGALCPQYYGYYTPDDPTDGKKVDHYLSPILLLEHCGSQVVPDQLNEDDRQECASLLFRFHHAGWLHDSFADRNILWQKGKPTQWPIERTFTQDKSFRLIDFGRSKLLESSDARTVEEETGLELFHLHHYAKN